MESTIGLLEVNANYYYATWRKNQDIWQYKVDFTTDTLEAHSKFEPAQNWDVADMAVFGEHLYTYAAD